MKWDKILDYPKECIEFYDLTPSFQEGYLFKKIVLGMGRKIPENEIDFVVGIDARGFILGSGIALYVDRGFIPIRKKGKLPPPTISLEYATEYSNDALCMKPGKGKVWIVDDVLATGGTLETAKKLCENAGYDVIGASAMLSVGILKKDEYDLGCKLEVEKWL